MKLRYWGFVSALVGLAFLTACKTNKQDLALSPVKGFDANRYLGKWYELGRIENRFERGMTKTTAHYSLNHNGTIKVVNVGYDPAKGRNRSATGKAKFASSPDLGALRVSFFGPFYGGYNIIALDRNYKWSIVAGDNPKKYFWVLSRQPQLSTQLKNEALTVARKLGIDTNSILWVEQ